MTMTTTWQGLIKFAIGAGLVTAGYYMIMFMVVATNCDIVDPNLPPEAAILEKMMCFITSMTNPTSTLITIAGVIFFGTGLSFAIKGFKDTLLSFFNPKVKKT